MFTKRLIIFTGAVHYSRNGTIVAHAGFVREIDVWAQFFSRVLIVGFYDHNLPLADSIPYKNSNIEVTYWGISYSTKGVQGKFRLLYHLPSYIFTILKIMNKHDIVMARGPEAVGFLAAIVATLLGNIRFSRYTGEWSPTPRESMLHKFQKWYYRNYFKAPIAVYGTLDSKSPYTIPFITSSITKIQWFEAENAITEREWEAPYKLLTVGRLSPNKNVGALIQATHILLNRGYNVELHVVGQGEQRHLLEDLAKSLGIELRTFMHGHLSWEELKALYRTSHCLVHAAKSEGFPKVYIEAMTYGLPIVASAAGAAQFIIQPPLCGFIFEESRPEVIANRISVLLDNTAYAREMGKAGRTRVYNQGFLIDSLIDYYRSFLTRYVTNGARS